MPGDLGRVADYSASTLPSGGPGTTSRRFPNGTLVTPLPTRSAGGSAPAIRTPWQPYPAPYLGGGDAPDDWGLNFMVRLGAIGQGASKVPAGKNTVFTAPPNCTDGFYVWIVVSLAANGQMTAFDYDSGVTLPDALIVTPTAAGGYPATVYDLLFMVTSTATSVDYSSVQQIRSTPLNLVAIETVSDVLSSYQVYVTPGT